MKNKGITLIALVITIIVLLILAGISIATLSGENGILTQASKASEETERAEAKEQAQLEIANWRAEKLQKGEKAILNDSVVKGLITGKDYVGIVRENSFTTKKSGYEIQYSELYGISSTQKYNYTDPDGNKATIPEGLTVSEKEEENKVNTGLVVTDSEGNEFVWIPVETAVASSEEEGTATKAMAVNFGSDTEPIYRGLLYKFTSTSSEVIGNCTTTTTGNREPDIMKIQDSNPDYLNIINDILGTNLSNSEQLKEQMQEEYNEMIESVKKYGGFYVARYEASESNGKVESKPNSTALKANNTTRWHGLYAKSKTYVTSSVKSTMIWGSQYDAMMNWMIINGIDVNSVELPNGGVRNASESITGVEGSTDILNNIYDLYGGKYELTLETSFAGGDTNSDCRIRRCGCYNSTGNSYVPSARFFFNVTAANASVGARHTIFIR